MFAGFTTITASAFFIWYLADRIAAVTVIGYFSDTVISVCVTECIMALRSVLELLKESCTVMFRGGHFLFTYFDTFAVITELLQIKSVWNSQGAVG